MVVILVIYVSFRTGVFHHSKVFFSLHSLHPLFLCDSLKPEVPLVEFRSKCHAFISIHYLHALLLLHVNHNILSDLCITADEYTITCISYNQVFIIQSLLNTAIKDPRPFNVYIHCLSENH